MPEDPILTALDKDEEALEQEHDAISHEDLENDAVSPPISVNEPFELPQEEFDDFDDFDELGEDGVDDDASTATFMLPPSRRSSVTDLSEEVPHTRAKYPLHRFVMAMGMWAETSGVSRQHYQGLLEVLGLLEDLQTLKDLPRTVSTLKKWVQGQLPLIKLRRHKINVDQERMPTHQGLVAQPESLMYFFDPIDLFKTVLSSTSFRNKMHVGMANFVDSPSELFESMSWATSIRSCSGEYVYYSKRNDEPIFQSDVAYYRCIRDGCFCGQGKKFHVGRVYAIGKDKTTGSRPGSVKVIINPLYTLQQFGLSVKDFPMPLNSKAQELILSEERLYLDHAQIISREADVHFDYRYEGPHIQMTGRASAYTSRLVVRNVWDMKTTSTRPLMLSAPIRGELELSTYGRSHLISFGKQNNTLCVPLLTFIDAFGLYRNMYRSLMGIYATIAALNWRERKRRANVFPLALGPHATDFADVIKVLEPGLVALDRGVTVDLSGDGNSTLLCVFTLAFTGDMKQQQDNSGFMSPIANRGCAKCLVTKNQKSNLTFNVVLNARYHHRSLLERIRGEQSTNRVKYFRSLGMQEEQTPLIAISPSLDLIRSRPGDAAHSEYAGIAKQAQYVLFEAVLTDSAATEYCAELRSFPFPSGWGRLQSPKHHLSSYRMQECGRLSIICPLLLRTWLQPHFINPLYLKAMEVTVSPVLDLQPIDAIVYCYAMMAKSNTILLSQNMSKHSRENITEILLQSRKSFQRLFECAAIAASSSFKRGEMPVSSRDATPLRARQDNEDSDIDDTFEDSDLQHLGRSEYDNLAEFYEVDGSISKKATAFRNFMARPNVHAALHYEDVVAEYATANNCTTLSGEDKHRFFKKAVTQTNFRDVERVLLTKESIHQTLRFVLAGSFAQNEPDLTREITVIHARCPTLLNDLLPYSEAGEDADEDDSPLPQSTMAAEGDESHKQPMAIGCLERSHVVNVLQWPLRPGYLDANDPFSVQLQAAYDIDYQEPNVVLPRKAGLQWCHKFSFRDRSVSPTASLCFNLAIPQPIKFPTYPILAFQPINLAPNKPLVT